MVNVADTRATSRVVAKSSARVVGEFAEVIKKNVAPRLPSLQLKYTYMKSVMPEAGINGKHK